MRRLIEGAPPKEGSVKNILKVIDLYAADYPKLLRCSGRYPAPAYYRAITKQGTKEIPTEDMAPKISNSDKRLSEGAKWLIECALRRDLGDRPLYVLLWGCATDLAYALSAKLEIKKNLRVVYLAGSNELKDPKSIKFIEAYHPDLWIVQNMYTYQGLRLGGNQEGDLDNFTFMQTHIRGHGAMGDWISLLKGGMIKMGDTPTVLFLLKGTPEDPTRPSWGGQFVKREGAQYKNWYVDRRDPDLMLHEVKGWNSDWWGAKTDRIKSEAVAEWERDLSRIVVRGGTEAQRAKFYTDLHHVLNGRTAVCDASGTFPNRMDEGHFKVEQVPLERPRHRMFNSDALWWTSWNLNLLWGLAYPEYYAEMVNAWLTWSAVDPLRRLPYGTIAGRHSWVMWGAQATPLIAHAIQIGLPGFDYEQAYEAMRRMHMHSPEEGGNMDGVREYLELGYVPFEADSHSASLTLEHAWCDWVLAQVARRLGKEHDYAYFLKRSRNWRNGWDERTGFMRPRMRDGSWKVPFDPAVGRDAGFIESNAIQASFFVPHDVPGLAEAMGGEERFTRRLDDLFRKSEPDRFAYPAPHGLAGYINYGNQVCMHVAHLFAHVGKPWLTQHWAREVYQKTFSHTDADGGYAWDDEDQGQLGGLSALLAIGLFSVDGGTGTEPRYELTAPVFDEVAVRLSSTGSDARSFVIRTENNAPANRYIQAARLNGKELRRAWITHREVAEGGVLELWLGPEPNMRWGTAAK